MMDSGFQRRMLSGDRGSPGGAANFRNFNPFRKPLKRSLLTKIREKFSKSLSVFMEMFHWIVRKRTELGTLRFSLYVTGIVALLFFTYFGVIWLLLPDIDDPRSLLSSQSTVIVDRNGTELYRLHGEEDRTYIDGKDIPKHLKSAVIAIEDERFYDRGCIDVKAVARAVFRLGQAGGASTITRQLARNALHLQRENIINRKVKELILGCQLEVKYSKEELIDLYLNWIPFGQNAYGVEQASSRYFGVSAKDLTLAQSVVLAALPQRPSYLSPYGSHVHTQVSTETLESIANGEITKVSQIPQDAITIGLLGNNVGTGSLVFYLGGRADQVLRNMEKQELISEQERLKTLEELEKISFQPARENIRAPHFVLWVRQELERMFKDSTEVGLLEQGGFTIETTIDWELQKAAESAVAFHREDLMNRFGANNIALVALDPKTREILAYVGNADYSDETHGGKVDMVQAPRQPGSSFKPFVYAAAFLQGYGPATILHDVPTKFGDDTPQNFDGTHWGILTARRALGGSRNIPAVKAFFLAGGEDPVLELAAKMGAGTPLQRKQELIIERGTFDYGWPLALGAGETPLLEMVQGYSTLTTGGDVHPITGIRKITNTHGSLLPCSSCFNPETKPESVLDPRVAYEVTSILSDVSARPNEYWQQVLSVPGFQAASKTGTSNKCLERNEKDGACKLRKPDNVWTIGVTPALAAGVWVGNADSSSLYEKADGLTVAAPIWRDFMAKAHKILKSTQTTFPVPEGLVQPQVSLLSGELPTECTPVQLRRADIFLAEHAPTLPDPACRELTVDKVTGLLASSACPKDAEEKQSFLVLESVLSNRWPLWQSGVNEWGKKQMELWNARPDHSGSILPLPVAPTEQCDPSLTPGRLIKPKLSIIHPSDGGLASYPSFQPKIDVKTGSSVRTITFALDGRVIETAGSGSDLTPPLRVPRSIKEEGSHTLTVTVTDQYYNIVTEEVKFRFGKDESGPSVRFLEPEDGTSVKTGEKIEMTANAEDPEGGIKYVQFYLGEQLLSTKPREPYRLIYTIEEPAGTYTLRAVATDLAGNTDEDSVEIIVTPE